MSLRMLVCGLYSLSLMAPVAAVRAAHGYSLKRDQEITRQVELLIAQRADLGTLLSVRTKEGIVFLGGLSPGSLAKSNAEEVAKQVAGVTKVVDLAGI